MAEFHLVVDPSLKHVDARRESPLVHKDSGMHHTVELVAFVLLPLVVASFPSGARTQAVGKDMAVVHPVGDLRTYCCKLVEHPGRVKVTDIDSFASHMRFVPQTEHALGIVPPAVYLRPPLAAVAELQEQGSCSVPRV